MTKLTVEKSETKYQVKIDDEVRMTSDNFDLIGMYVAIREYLLNTNVEDRAGIANSPTYQAVGDLLGLINVLKYLSKEEQVDFGYLFLQFNQVLIHEFANEVIAPTDPENCPFPNSLVQMVMSVVLLTGAHQTAMELNESLQEAALAQIALLTNGIDDAIIPLKKIKANYSQTFNVDSFTLNEIAQGVIVQPGDSVFCNRCQGIHMLEKVDSANADFSVMAVECNGIPHTAAINGHLINGFAPMGSKNNKSM